MAPKNKTVKPYKPAKVHFSTAPSMGAGRFVSLDGNGSTWGEFTALIRESKPLESPNFDIWHPTHEGIADIILTEDLLNTPLHGGFVVASRTSLGAHTEYPFPPFIHDGGQVNPDHTIVQYAPLIIPTIPQEDKRIALREFSVCAPCEYPEDITADDIRKIIDSLYAGESIPVSAPQVREYQIN